MNDIIKICAVSVIAAICAFVLKQSKADAPYVALIGAAVIIGSVLPKVTETFLPFLTVMKESGMDIYSSAMLKALGITMVVKITTDICSQLGQSSLCSAVEIAGKIQILILCLPIITQISSKIKELLI